LYAALEEFKSPKKRNDWGELVRSFPYVLIHEKDVRKGNYKVSNRYLK
jgi:hypothetical protein